MNSQNGNSNRFGDTMVRIEIATKDKFDMATLPDQKNPGRLQAMLKSVGSSQVITIRSRMITAVADTKYRTKDGHPISLIGVHGKDELLVVGPTWVFERYAKGVEPDVEAWIDKLYTYIRTIRSSWGRFEFIAKALDEYEDLANTYRGNLGELMILQALAELKSDPEIRLNWGFARVCQSFQENTPWFTSAQKKWTKFRKEWKSTPTRVPAYRILEVIYTKGADNDDRNGRVSFSPDKNTNVTERDVSECRQFLIELVRLPFAIKRSKVTEIANKNVVCAAEDLSKMLQAESARSWMVWTKRFGDALESLEKLNPVWVDYYPNLPESLSPLQYLHSEIVQAEKRSGTDVDLYGVLNSIAAIPKKAIQWFPTALMGQLWDELQRSVSGFQPVKVDDKLLPMFRYLFAEGENDWDTYQQPFGRMSAMMGGDMSGSFRWENAFPKQSALEIMAVLLKYWIGFTSGYQVVFNQAGLRGVNPQSGKIIEVLIHSIKSMDYGASLEEGWPNVQRNSILNSIQDSKLWLHTVLGKWEIPPDHVLKEAETRRQALKSLPFLGMFFPNLQSYAELV